MAVCALIALVAFVATQFIPVRSFGSGEPAIYGSGEPAA
jgi:hypothetical protein